MNLGEAKRIALVLMREWTIDGNVVPVAENADYLKSADDLANIALMDIARLRKIPAVAKLDSPLEGLYGNFMRHRLPQDCLEPVKIVYFVGDTKIDDPFWLYSCIDQDTIGLHKDASGDFMLHYYRLPKLFTPNPSNQTENDEIEFDVAPETHYLIPFFIAAQLLTDEDRGLAQVKLNEYHTRLAGLFTPTTPQAGKLQNVFGW